MKIVDRKTFLEMRPGTIYAKYEPCVFGELNIKWQSYPNNDGTGYSDWVCQGLGAEIARNESDDLYTQCKRAENGEDVPVDYDFAGRDGLYDQDQLFAVFSRKDVEDLIARLKETIEPSELEK